MITRMGSRRNDAAPFFIGHLPIYCGRTGCRQVALLRLATVYCSCGPAGSWHLAAASPVRGILPRPPRFVASCRGLPGSWHPAAVSTKASSSISPGKMPGTDLPRFLTCLLEHQPRQDAGNQYAAVTFLSLLKHQPRQDAGNQPATYVPTSRTYGLSAPKVDVDRHE
ncbi:hypothetical protein GGR28_000611 [Lewinella aquimaris]|uniref:Uncharacterized protein n=1 Tax=Neolewinella aquimaris TaxID=1835722 RepID=A0A840DYN3_9BACT|nr:hypothetical protein [Neolewinella aquimaris]